MTTNIFIQERMDSERIMAKKDIIKISICGKKILKNI